MCDFCKYSNFEPHYDPVQWMHFFQSPLGGAVVRSGDCQCRLREFQRRERKERLQKSEGLVSLLRHLFWRRRADVAS